MAWSPQAREAAARARANKRKGTPVSRAKAALPTERTGKQRNLLLGLHEGSTAKDRRKVRTAKRAAYKSGLTNKPQHQVSVTGVGNAAHGVSAPHAKAPKFSAAAYRKQGAKLGVAEGGKTARDVRRISRYENAHPEYKTPLSNKKGGAQHSMVPVKPKGPPKGSSAYKRRNKKGK